MKQFFETLFYLFVTIGIFVLTYYTTKFLSRHSTGASGKRNLEVIEKIPLGKDKQAAILRVGKEYYLVGISGSSVQFSGNPLPSGTVETDSKGTEEKEEVRGPAAPVFTGPAGFITTKLAALITLGLDRIGIKTPMRRNERTERPEEMEGTEGNQYEA